MSWIKLHLSQLGRVFQPFNYTTKVHNKSGCRVTNWPSIY